ncbi:hypothetical protein [Saccharothrix syringae]|uniref:Uncharacterized protein n=1 Tax=Saccharothrix syringae TaxID=103733 RepID=A0A5Q0H2U1_SACSY|nr:hypothetical protein [Saccharothrix syringae]QFZ20511.1 hypothetical protein EKG83_26655 [Saccharothrix syringae]
MDDIPAAGSHGGITDYLDYLDRLVRLGDDATRASLLNGELPKLVATVRDLIEQHRPDSKGRCPCHTWWRRGRTPSCRVRATVHRHLIAVEPAAPRSSAARHATPADQTTGASSAGR